MFLQLFFKFYYIHELVKSYFLSGRGVFTKAFLSCTTSAYPFAV